MIHVSQGENLEFVAKMMAEVPKFLRCERSSLVGDVLPLAFWSYSLDLGFEVPPSSVLVLVEFGSVPLVVQFR